ncbi:uncharacterized protein LOC131221941 [Magnolia sinica]|uniref:uncharacterized protein LOC131221941 n=1 Tax=Magnolia sinica TaxID=86752 RepID=UPI002659CCD6|nr:uncharacterized protein LOC131221941 [Magnolia sinica]
MGSCCSKQKKKPTPPPHPHFPAKPPVSESDPQLEDNLSRAPPPPPPPPIEEETVKEVLPETSKPSIPKFEEEDENEKKAPIVINGCDEISEISDLCSLSESVSTTTMTEKKGEDGDDGEVEMRRVENRSPAKFQRKRSVPGDFTGRRDRGGKSPARRSEPSPGRRTPGREQTNRARIPAGNHGFRRDVGENSGRRSRSPATRAERNAAARRDLGRSPSARKTGRSPARIPAGLADEGGRRPAERKEDGGVPPANESLENPLVSLECFIFL